MESSQTDWWQTSSHHASERRENERIKSDGPTARQLVIKIVQIARLFNERRSLLEYSRIE